MDRLFQTHEIRKSRTCDPLWTLTTPDEGGLSKPEKVTVPGIWESHPALRRYRGRGIYEQDIVCGGHVRFFFGGVSFRSRVYLDDILLAEHYGAYTGFEALAKGLARGRHRLRVEADNRYGADSALHIPNDYYAYGGINRPVVFEELGDAYIAQCHVISHHSEAGWTAEAGVTVRNLTNSPITARLSLTIGDAQRENAVLLQPEEEKMIPFSLFCGQVRSWSPEDPALYPVKIRMSIGGKTVDDWIDRTGFREIRTEGKQILLNGKPVQLRGFNRHEEYGSFGAAVPLEGMVQDIQLMRHMGANCVRTCHYPNDPRFLDLCDEMGMLVWEESHARGLSETQMRHPLFMEQVMQSTREMVQQHMNHPCIFIWGCLNECADDTEFGAECYRSVFSLLRALDQSRPVTAALLERPGGRVYGQMDAVSVNLYPQWYRDSAVHEALERKIREIDANGGCGKPLIISETGAGAIYGFHDPLGRAKWSEERQCEILRKQISTVLNHPDICGIFLWQFADVRVSEEWFMNRPRTYNNKGIVDEFRRPKMAYRTVQELFRSQE